MQKKKELPKLFVKRSGKISREASTISLQVSVIPEDTLSILMEQSDSQIGTLEEDTANEWEELFTFF